MVLLSHKGTSDTPLSLIGWSRNKAKQHTFACIRQQKKNDLFYLTLHRECIHKVQKLENKNLSYPCLSHSVPFNENEREVTSSLCELSDLFCKHTCKKENSLSQ